MSARGCARATVRSTPRSSSGRRREAVQRRGNQLSNSRKWPRRDVPHRKGRELSAWQGISVSGWRGMPGVYRRLRPRSILGPEAARSIGAEIAAARGPGVGYAALAEPFQERVAAERNAGRAQRRASLRNTQRFPRCSPSGRRAVRSVRRSAPKCAMGPATRAPAKCAAMARRSGCGRALEAMEQQRRRAATASPAKSTSMKSPSGVSQRSRARRRGGGRRSAA